MRIKDPDFPYKYDYLVNFCSGMTCSAQDTPNFEDAVVSDNISIRRVSDAWLDFGWSVLLVVKKDGMKH